MPIRASWGAGRRAGVPLLEVKAMKKNYLLLSVFPVPREKARLYIHVTVGSKRAYRVLENYTVFTRFKKDKKQRDTVLLNNNIRGKNYILIANSTAVTLAKRLMHQLDYFFKFKNENRLSTGGDWKTTFIVNYFNGQPLNVVKLYHHGEELSKDDIKAMMELYFEGKFDKVETFKVLPDNFTEYTKIGFYLIDTHEEESLNGTWTTRYFLLLVP